ncbi:uncharacterized protein CMU_006030 [Cryptosporidium muris RN66]|uniref:Uncharacterized protein n=1 Tax=Cryptosporidium muris (strain RN66) TaxID=441375 RepID=B6AHI5_CRYMR|nr:uncharacterized protein CMU_006030 [Cryptosporidium muris RN66]EEA07680.1 hypothetical protein, conserved [Cryptosporidium muris RN66]|eukprot:XP_002142029.1 hypothetical protein [Cryptosporidium muris RN66]
MEDIEYIRFYVKATDKLLYELETIKSSLPEFIYSEPSSKLPLKGSDLISFNKQQSSTANITNTKLGLSTIKLLKRPKRKVDTSKYSIPNIQDKEDDLYTDLQSLEEQIKDMKDKISLLKSDIFTNSTTKPDTLPIMAIPQKWDINPEKSIESSQEPELDPNLKKWFDELQTTSIPSTNSIPGSKYPILDDPTRPKILKEQLKNTPNWKGSAGQLIKGVTPIDKLSINYDDEDRSILPEINIEIGVNEDTNTVELKDPEEVSLKEDLLKIKPILSDNISGGSIIEEKDFEYRGELFAKDPIDFKNTMEDPVPIDFHNIEDVSEDSLEFKELKEIFPVRQKRNKSKEIKKNSKIKKINTEYLKHINSLSSLPLSSSKEKSLELHIDNIQSLDTLPLTSIISTDKFSFKSNNNKKLSNSISKIKKNNFIDSSGYKDLEFIQESNLLSSPSTIIEEENLSKSLLSEKFPLKESMKNLYSNKLNQINTLDNIIIKNKDSIIKQSGNKLQEYITKSPKGKSFIQKPINTTGYTDLLIEDFKLFQDIGNSFDKKIIGKIEKTESQLQDNINNGIVTNKQKQISNPTIISQLKSNQINKSLLNNDILSKGFYKQNSDITLIPKNNSFNLSLLDINPKHILSKNLLNITLRNQNILKGTNEQINNKVNNITNKESRVMDISYNKVKEKSEDKENQLFIFGELGTNIKLPKRKR